MALSLSLLLLITFGPQGILSVCKMGENEECISAPFVPGHSLSGRGFDLVRMEHSVGVVLDAQTHTNSCMLCINFLMGTKTQKLPSFMSTWIAERTQCGDFSSSVFTSVGSLVERVASSAVGSAWRKDLSLEGSTSRQLEGSRSTVASYATSRAGSDKTHFTLHQLSCSQYKYSLKKNLFSYLHPDFSKKMLSLPRDLTSDTRPAYRRFISTYGTHYITGAELGGRLTQVTSVRQCLASLNKISVHEVRECVRIGLSVGLGRRRPSEVSSRCRDILNNRDTVTDYYQGFLHHRTEATGGSWRGSISMKTNDSERFHLWKDSLKSEPGAISFSLLPLHSLISDLTISQNLRQVVTEYISENGITKHPRQPYCNKPNLSSQCCPLRVRRGRLEVKVISARGLYGDVIGQTDAYVKIRHGDDYRVTRWIESNPPEWNEYFDFGNVDIRDRLKLQVWDKDDVKSDDYLGGCCVDPEKGGNYNLDMLNFAYYNTHNCRLQHGCFAFSYKVTCDNHLTGSKCQEYTPSIN